MMVHISFSAMMIVHMAADSVMRWLVKMVDQVLRLLVEVGVESSVVEVDVPPIRRRTPLRLTPQGHLPDAAPRCTISAGLTVTLCLRRYSSQMVLTTGRKLAAGSH